MIKANFNWTEYNLFKFIENPKKYMPGTKCNIRNNGIESITERADLIKFFKVFTKQFYKNLRLKSNQAFGKDYVDNSIKVQKKLNEK